MDVQFIQLAQFHIDKSSAFGGAVFDDVQIFRRETHHIGDTEKFAGPANWHPIDRDPLGLVFLQMHVDAIGNIVLSDLHLDVGLILVEPDNIPVFCVFMGF